MFLSFLKKNPQGDALRVRVNDTKLQAALAKLPARLNENVRKRAARKVFKPAAIALAQRWLTANFRGPGAKHRLAIAAAHEVDVRRSGPGPQAPIRVKVGVRYGRKAKASATTKGRQKVFHLLESGFRHKKAKKRIIGRYLSFAWSRANLNRLTKEFSDQALIEAHKELQKLGVSK